MQDRIRGSVFGSPALHSLSLSVLLALLGARAPQQFPVDLGNLFEVILHLVVVLDPAADFRHFLLGDDAACGAAPSQSNGQIPDRPMPLALGALAARISAGHISLHQRTAQNLRDRRKQFRQTLPPLAQGQFRKPAEPNAGLHLNASIHPKQPFGPFTNLPGYESPPTALIQKERKLLCEVPAARRLEPLETQDFFWWRRRFRLRPSIVSRLLRGAVSLKRLSTQWCRR